MTLLSPSGSQASEEADLSDSVAKLAFEDGPPASSQAPGPGDTPKVRAAKFLLIRLTSQGVILPIEATTIYDGLIFLQKELAWRRKRDAKLIAAKEYLQTWQYRRLLGLESNI